MRDLDPESIYDPSGGINIASLAKLDPGLANDLEWTYANIALQYRKPPDSRPLAALLRSEKPIPRGIREGHAELLDPGKLILSDITLKPVRKRGVTHRKKEFFVNSLRAVITYEQLLRAGKSAADARAEAAKKYKWQCDESVFNRHRKLVLAHLARWPRGLGERIINGETIITGKNSGK
jgi:hypothetical protein